MYAIFHTLARKKINDVYICILFERKNRLQRTTRATTNKEFPMKHFNLLSLFFCLTLLSSCLNEEGEGGNSSIEGTVYKVLHSDDIFNFDVDTFPAAKEDVYITYGDSKIYGDKMETGYNGFFKFRFLTKGNYLIYSYSTIPGGKKVAVFDTISISNGETKKTKDIYIHEGKSLETSYIKGQVLVNYFDNTYPVGTNKTGAGQRVYIRVEGAAFQFDEVRAGADGVFMFQKLDPGNYEVYVLSENKNNKILVPITQKVTILKKGIIQEIPTPFIISINI